jgi:hypothetical protein
MAFVRPGSRLGSRAIGQHSRETFDDWQESNTPPEPMLGLMS